METFILQIARSFRATAPGFVRSDRMLQWVVTSECGHTKLKKETMLCLHESKHHTTTNLTKSNETMNVTAIIWV